MKEIYIYDAIKIMRKLSAQNFPFEISFISCDLTRKESGGLRIYKNVILAKGISRKKSEFADFLIAFEDLDTGEKKRFWLPLLMTFNNLKISHDRILRR